MCEVFRGEGSGYPTVKGEQRFAYFIELHTFELYFGSQEGETRFLENPTRSVVVEMVSKFHGHRNDLRITALAEKGNVAKQLSSLSAKRLELGDESFIFLPMKVINFCEEVITERNI
jgi:hypothetical protein